MAKKTVLAAGTSPFAHLLGGAAALAGRALGKKAEDETPVDEEGPDDEDDAIDDTEVDDVEEGGDPDAKGKKSRSKKAKVEDDDEPAAEEPEDEAEAKAFRAGFAAANKRASAIFRSASAGARPDMAAQLAFGSSVTAAEAVGILNTAAVPTPERGSRLDDRMSERNEPRPGADGGRSAGSGKPSFVDRMAAAKKKAGIA